MLPDLTPITRKAAADPQCRFTALAHYLNMEFLADTWSRMNPRATRGNCQTVEEFDAVRAHAIWQWWHLYDRAGSPIGILPVLAMG